MRHVAMLHLDGASDRSSHRSSPVINVNKFSSYVSKVQIFFIFFFGFWVVVVVLGSLFFVVCVFIVLCNLLTKAT